MLGNQKYVNLSPKGEPQLGRRGLYTSLFGEGERALLWVLNQSDGDYDLLEIAEKSGVSLGALRNAAERLVSNNLLKVLPDDL